MLHFGRRRENPDAGSAPGFDAVSNEPEERRARTRHITVLRVALLHARDTKELCVVRNLSAGGLSARVYRSFAVGETLQVEFRSDERIEGSVKWVRDFEVGVAFSQEIDVEAVLTNPWATDGGRRQRLPRIDLECPCQLRVGAGFHLGDLVDISQGGAKLRLRRPLRGSADAVLNLPGLG